MAPQQQQSGYYGYPSSPSGELPNYNTNTSQRRDFVQDLRTSNGFKDSSNGTVFQGESHHAQAFDVRHSYRNNNATMQNHTPSNSYVNLHNSHNPQSHLSSRDSPESYPNSYNSRPRMHPNNHQQSHRNSRHSAPESHPYSRDVHPKSQSHSNSYKSQSQQSHQSYPDSHHPHPQSHPQSHPRHQTSQLQLHQHTNQQLRPHSHSNYPPQRDYSHNPCAQPLPQQQLSSQGVAQQQEVFPCAQPSSYIQGCDSNTIAVGVPVGRPIYMNNPYVISPPTMPQIQQSPSHWQPSYPQTAPILAALPKPSVTTFASPQSCHQVNLQSNIVETQTCSSGTQYPNFQRVNLQHSNGSKTSLSHPCVDLLGAQNDMLSSYNPETQSVDVSRQSDIQGNVQQLDVERTLPKGTCKLSNGQNIDHQKEPTLKGRFYSGENSLGSAMNDDHRHQNFPRKESFANGRQFSSIGRNDHHLESHVKNNSGQPFPRRDQNEKYYAKDNDAARVNHCRGIREDKYGGSSFNRGMGGRSTSHRSQQQQLRCDPCDRTFGNRGDFDAHLNSHIKCGEEGCTFEASGKVIKEHKVIEHGKTNAPTTAIGRKALALRLTENKDEVARWRQERKNNYPTSANILQKTEQRKKREAAGIFFDEELEKRRTQMREVLARQKRLGFQAAEIPPKYFMSHNNEKRQKPIRNAEHREHNMVNKISFSVGGSERPLDGKVNIEETVDGSQNIDDDKVPCRVEKRQNSLGKECLSKRKRRKRHSSGSDDVQMQIRQPTLLSKLLERDIKKENSYLLQCCRFIVNNSFLQHSPSTLKYFHWNIEAGGASSNGISSPVDMKMVECSENSFSRKNICTSEDVPDTSLLLQEDAKGTNTEYNKVVIVEK